MIALDTNILVYARRKEATHHGAALKLLKKLVAGDEPWALPWPCVYEFLRVVTHPRVFDPPSRLDVVLEDLESLFRCPALVLLGEGPAHPAHLLQVVGAGEAVGNLAHDAHIAALALEHGVSEVWTTDRDFARFPGLRLKNPFLASGVGEPRRRYRAAKRRRSAGARRGT